MTRASGSPSSTGCLRGEISAGYGVMPPPEIEAAVLPQQTYAFHGLTIAIAGDLPATRLLGARFQAFPCLPPRAEPDLAFEFRWGDSDGSTPPRPTGARPVYDFPDGEFLYYDGRDELHLTFRDRIAVECDAVRGRVTTSVLDREPLNHWLAAHLFFTIPFIELLKRRGLYSVHAAGLELGGRGLLLAGSSGSGKSTLAVALLDAGLEFLGDDMLFLALRSEGVRVLAFPDELDIAPDACALLPVVSHLANVTPSAGTSKHRVSPAELNVTDQKWECAPRVVVFPKIAHADRSTLTRIDAQEALVELAPNVLLTEPHSCRAHLHALARLAAEAACYRLDTGRDFDRLPRLLRGLLG